MQRAVAVCCTWDRPKQLENAIACFLEQDYENKFLVVLDDAGQYPCRFESNWMLISVPARFRTLGEKRNAVAALVPDADIYCVWDDDDVYLPWHISECVYALQSADFVMPNTVFTQTRKGIVKRATAGLFHGSWAYTRDVFTRVSGYPFMQSGQDQGLFKRFKELGVARGSWERTSYVYRWFAQPGQRWHLSALGPKGYETLKAPLPYKKPLHPALLCNWVELCATVS